jgi:DNA-binding response OmpR family regulator
MIKAPAPAARAVFRIVDPPRPCVLLVEDDHDVRRVLALALRRAGITVLEAETAAAARRVVDHAWIDLIVTDIALPGEMNGLRLGEWLRIFRSDMPVIYITGLVGWELPMLPRQDRITMVVCKPFGARAIVAAVTAMLDRTGTSSGEEPNG